MADIPLQLDKTAGDPGEEGDDAIVDECLADALGLFPDALPAGAEADHRRFLRAFILSHPAARALYDQIRRDRHHHAANVASGDVAKDGVLLDAEGAELSDGTHGGRR